MRLRFCAAAQIKMSLRVIEGVGAHFAARQQVPLVHDAIMAVFLSLDRDLMSNFGFSAFSARFLATNSLITLFAQSLLWQNSTLSQNSSLSGCIKPRLLKPVSSSSVALGYALSLLCHL